MNSYPHEFLSHPQPLMFVAGLSEGTSSRRPSVNTSTLLAPTHTALTTPISSPVPEVAPVLAEVDDVPEPAAPADQEFDTLVKDLRGAIATKSGKGKVWLPEKERRDFRILLVDKGVRLPLRKLAPPTPAPNSPETYSPPVSHSPLSPLTLSSPLYPDGLIAPVWVRKHAELVPSVFVLFLRLYEDESGEKEKEMDDLLIKEIGDRRKRLGERGIKLTIVLMASAATLDSPTLDPRLSALRRASALSSKASLFVLSPVPASQLPDFVQSLQDALYDSAMEYYGAHAKRVKRKRARVPVSQLGGVQLPQSSRGLGSQGWAARYDWKAGWFAEVRGEHDLARRYRIFGELLEYGVQAGLRIPVLALPVFPTAMAAAQPPPPEYYATPISSTNPLQVLQTPAFYFFTAACCSVKRAEKFEEALEVEVSDLERELLISQRDVLSSEAGAAAGHVSAAPGFANEKKVDHAALVVELFTKAYTLLKEQEFAQTRVALYVAFRIAETYCQSGQYDMAMRFFDRISSSFKRERWQPIVKQIRALWYECAQKTGDMEIAARLLVEMMSTGQLFSARSGASLTGSGSDVEEKGRLQDDWITLLKTTETLSADSLVIESDSADALLDVRAGFWKSQAVVASRISYQVQVTCLPDVEIARLEFSSLTIAFSDNRPDVTVDCSLDITSDLIKVMQGESAKAALRWTPGRSLTICGEMTSEEQGEVQISSVKLGLNQGSWSIQLLVNPDRLDHWSAGEKSIVPVHELSPSVYHQPSGYVGESFPVLAMVTNQDERIMEITLSVFLQPGDEDDLASITVDQESSQTLLKDVSLGVLKPLESIVKTIYLKSPVIGDRFLDFSLISTPGTPVPQKEDAVQLGQSEEKHQTSTIPIIDPFLVSTSVKYPPSRVAKEGTAVVTMVISTDGPRALHIENLELKVMASDGARLISSSLSSYTAFPQVWTKGNSFAISSNFALNATRRASAMQGAMPPPAEMVCVWKTENGSDPIETIIPLPPLILPLPRESFITAFLLPPAYVRLHQSFELALHVTNSHPSIAAAYLTVQVDTADAFVWLGNRTTRLPVVQPGETFELKMEMMAVGGVGWFSLPNVKVWDGEGELRRTEIRVVDAREEEQRVERPKDGIAVFVRP
ncbi:trafficking protein particle complex subunit 11, partial [Tremellales sp. Uapishka_1]